MRNLWKKRNEMEVVTSTDDQDFDHNTNNVGRSPLHVFHSTRSQEIDDDADAPTLPKVNFLPLAREGVGDFLKWSLVENSILGMIFINGIMIGLNTFDFISKNEDAARIFNIIDMVFLIIFTIELSLHLFHLGPRFLRKGWVVFDFILIATSWTLDSGSIKAMRALRILRILPRIETLRLVIMSIFAVMPQMGSVGILLSLIMFIFSIFMTQIFGEIHEDFGSEVDYFSRLDYTILTLFQLMTLDNWADLVRDIMSKYTWAWVPLFIYIILTGIIVTNIVIAIICDSVLHMSKEKDQEEEEKTLKSQTKQMYKEIRDLRDELERKINSDGNGFNNDMAEGASSQPQSINSESNGNELTPLERMTSRQSMSSNQHSNGIRNKCGDFVNSKSVQNSMMTLIIINSLMMAITTFDFVKDDPSVLNAFDKADTVFLSIYTIEACMQLFYHGVYIYKDKWVTFDLFLVILSWSLAFTNIPVQSARSLRIIRLLRIIPKLEAIRIIVQAVVNVLPKLAGIAGILCLIYYIFAVILTELFKDYNLDGDYFSRLDVTMFTLFQIMTMEDWASLSRELMEESYWAPIPIIVFLIISGFIFLNLIIALICEAMGSIDDIRENEKLKQLNAEMGSISTFEEPGLGNIDRLELIAEHQKEIRRLLQSCTIVTNQEYPLPQSRKVSVVSLDDFFDAHCFPEDENDRTPSIETSIRLSDRNIDL